MNRRGFTIVELIIIITIMGILLTLGVVNLRGSQVNARDAERKTDIESIAQHLETFYTAGNDASATDIDCTGGTITHVGGYTIHTFATSGTLTCTKSTFNAEVLVVAGGGSGGGSQGTSIGSGGGGAGGVVYNNSYSIPPQSYPVTVGTGGIGVTGFVVGNNGQNSTFGTITSIGGGYGGTWTITPSVGGSGGGAGENGQALDGAAGTAGQGYAGGNDNGYDAGAPSAAGGGGGAGAIGSNSTTDTIGGNGGVGISNSITGSPVFYAGGGGGAGSTTLGSGGNGGGGNGRGVSTGTGINGVDGTGGGGGGSLTNVNETSQPGGNGGSGVVIVKYSTPLGVGSYPSTALTSNVPTDSVMIYLRDIDVKSITAPGVTDWTKSFTSATNSLQTTADVTPQPFTTINIASQFNYVYQPINTNGTLCTAGQECRKFNLYYRLEKDNMVQMVTSRNQ